VRVMAARRVEVEAAIAAGAPPPLAADGGMKKALYSDGVAFLTSAAAKLVAALAT
jgi:hypothetical protein